MSCKNLFVRFFWWLNKYIKYFQKSQILLKNHLQSKEPIIVTILFSHMHHYHNQGFPFFKPAYMGTSVIYLFGPKFFREEIEEVVDETSSRLGHFEGGRGGSAEESETKKSCCGCKKRTKRRRKQERRKVWERQTSQEWALVKDEQAEPRKRGKLWGEDRETIQGSWERDMGQRKDSLRTE